MTDAVLELDLSRPVRTEDIPKLARAFLSWWGGELAALVPQRYRAAFARAQPLTIFVGEGAWRLSGAGEGSDVSLDFDRPAGELRDDIRRILGANHGPDTRVFVPVEQVLIRRIELPMLSDARIGPAVALQIDRLTPFKSDTVRFSCRVVERNIETNKVTLDVATAPPGSIEQIEARLSAVGLKPVGIDVASGSSPPGLGFDLRAQRASGGKTRERAVDAGIAVGALFLWMMAFYAWSAAGEVEIARWQAKVVETKPKAERSATLKREIDVLMQPVEIAKSRQVPGALAVLQELTSLLPDDAHLIELRLTDRQVEIAGLAADAPSLIAKLESSKIFADVRFKSPVTRRPNVTQDRFDLSLAFENKAKP